MTRCPYKVTTVEEEDDLESKIKFIMETCTRTCRQDQTHIIDLKLKNKIKELVCLDIEKKIHLDLHIFIWDKKLTILYLYLVKTIYIKKY